MTTRLSRVWAAAILSSFLPLSGSALALDSALMESLDPHMTSRLETPAEVRKQNEFQGLIQFEGAQYQSSIPEDSALNQSFLANAELKAQRTSGILDSKADLRAEKYLDWGSSHYSMPELYAGLVWGEGQTELTLGRKKQFWSQIDQAWDLGLWQPRDYFDGLRPEAQGLTGAFFRHQQGAVEILGFASSIYIPSMGPEIKEENGKLVSRNRWYRAPSSTFLLMSKEHRAFYSLQIPEIEELIQQPSAGGRLCVGCGQKGIFASVNSGYKPMNTLLIKYTRWLYLTEESTQDNTGSAPVVPAVGYHYLAGADLGYQFEKSSISVSYLEDRPTDLEQPEDDPFIVQRANPMKAYSAQLQSQWSAWGFMEPIGLTFGYLRIHGGELGSYDSQGKPHESPFTHRFNFTNAASVQADFASTLFGKKWISRLKYMREFDQLGMAANAEMSVYPRQNFALTLGADVLGVDDSSEENKDDRFLNSFRANDRVYGGVSYVF